MSKEEADNCAFAYHCGYVAGRYGAMEEPPAQSLDMEDVAQAAAVPFPRCLSEAESDAFWRGMRAGQQAHRRGVSYGPWLGRAALIAGPLLRSRLNT